MTGRHALAKMVVVVLAILVCFAAPVGVVAGPLDGSPSGKRDDSDKKSRKKSSDKGVSKSAGKKKSSGDHAKRKGRGRLVLKEAPANERREAKFLRDLGEGFKVKHTKHYTIFYNTNEEDVKMFSISIEKIYTQVTRYIHKLGIDVKEPKYKLITHYFDTFEQYCQHSIDTGNRVIQEGTLGYYMPVSFDSDEVNPLSNMTFFYNIRNTPWFRGAKLAAEARRKQLREINKGRKLSPGQRRAIEGASREAIRVRNSVSNRGLEMTESTLQHEITHQVLFNVGFHNFGCAWGNPRWLAEGMAQIFETPSDGKFWGIALVNDEKLDAFNYLKQREMLVPVREFVTDPRYFFRSDAGGLAYPQSWGLLHYISRKYRDELKAYVDLLNARPVEFETTPEKELETFEKAFGPLDERWEKSWLRWMDNLRA